MTQMRVFTRSHSPTSLTERAWFWPLSVTGLVLGSFLLWLPALDQQLHYDATVYATAAYWWARGDTLYEYFTMTRPQGIMVVFRLMEAAGLGSPRGIQFVGALWCAACTALLLAVVARVWGRAIGSIAATLFAVIMATPSLEGTTTNAELFMLLPLLASLYLLLRAEDFPLGSRRNLAFIAGCGICAALTLQLKPSGATVLVLAAIWLLRCRQAGRHPWGALLRAEVVLGLSFLLGIVPALLHGLLTAPEIFLFAVVFYRLDKTVAGDPWSLQVWRFFVRSFMVLLSLPILLLVPAGMRAAWRDPDKRGRDLLVLWFLTSLAGAAMGGYWWTHYFQQLLPPLVVAVALGLRGLRWGTHHGPAMALRQAGAVTGGLCLLITLLLGMTTRADYVQLLTGANKNRETISIPVGMYLREHTAPDDRIYVLYERPEIYYYAQRWPSSRWVDIPDLVRIPGAFDQQVRILTDPATVPRYIALVQPFDEGGLDPQGELRALIARDYDLEAVVEGVPIYRRNK